MSLSVGFTHLEINISHFLCPLGVCYPMLNDASYDKSTLIKSLRVVSFLHSIHLFRSNLCRLIIASLIIWVADTKRKEKMRNDYF